VVVLIDIQRARPLRERGFDQRAHLAPGQAAVARADLWHRDRGYSRVIGLGAHGRQGCSDRLIAGAAAPVVLLGAKVEHPWLAFLPPQPGVAEVELARLRAAALAVGGVHRRVARAEGLGDAGTHRALAVTAVGKRLHPIAIHKEVTRNKLEWHELALIFLTSVHPSTVYQPAATKTVATRKRAVADSATIIAVFCGG
jgi:hypothetical protein